MTQGLLYYCHIEAMLRLLHKLLITARISVICTLYPFSRISPHRALALLRHTPDVRRSRCALSEMLASQR